MFLTALFLFQVNGVKSKVDTEPDADEGKEDDGRSPAMLEINSNFEEVRSCHIFC